MDNEKRKIFKVKAAGKVFTMISMSDITEDEADYFVQGKWEGAKVERT